MPDAGQPRIDLAELRTALLDRVEALAEHLTGEAPNKKRSRRGEQRFGDSGGLSLLTTGRQRGEWFDHRAAKGGGPLDLVMHLRRCGFDEAAAWAAAWAGITPGDGGSAKNKPQDDDQARQERERQRQQREAEQAADEAQRLADARRFAAEMVPVAIDTLADHYITQIRGIPRPADGWPAVIGFHSGERSLIAARVGRGPRPRATAAIGLSVN